VLTRLHLGGRGLQRRRKEEARTEQTLAFSPYGSERLRGDPKGSEPVRGWCVRVRSLLMPPSFRGCRNQGHVSSPGAGEHNATDDWP